MHTILPLLLLTINHAKLSRRTIHRTTPSFIRHLENITPNDTPHRPRLAKLRATHTPVTTKSHLRSPPPLLNTRPHPLLHRRRAPPPRALTLPYVATGPLDLPLGLASWALIYVYQLCSSRFTAAWASQNCEARAVWARYILEKGDYILGVQTLRNGLTSASFFSSACFTCLSLLIGIASQNLATLTRVALLKFATTGLLLIGSALAYLQSVRYMNTCAFLFQVANDQRDESTSRGTVMLLMVLAHNCWAAGEKMLYLLMPAVIWLVAGGVVLLPFVIGFLPILYFTDLPAPTNLLSPDEPSLKPYDYILNHGRVSKLFDFLDFAAALRTAQSAVAKSGDYAKEKYGLEAAQWPPSKPASG